VREQLHPADEYAAFAGLHAKGVGAEDIAARFGVTAKVVRQRLRLGAASPKLIALYREGTINLDQLMAFCLTDDQARQEQVYEALAWNKSPQMIRQMLTEQHVAVTDRRAVLVGVEAYETAGGAVMRDLFDERCDGYLADVALLDRLVMEKLEQAAVEVRAEGWKWVEASVDYPHDNGCRRVYPVQRKLTKNERKRLEKAEAQSEAIAIEYEAVDELPEDVSARLDSLQAEIDATFAFNAEDVSRGGAFVCVGHDGALRIERGLIRPEDEAQRPKRKGKAGLSSDGQQENDDEQGEGSGHSDKLVADLTAHRTAALRDTLAQNPDVALVAAVHVLAGQTFYLGFHGSCLTVQAQSTGLERHATLDGTPAGKSIAARHEQWARQMPGDAADLWRFVASLDHDSLMALFAHCVSLTVDAVKLPRDGRREALAHADVLAQTVNLDMAAYWTATSASYFGRVTKPLILEAVREGSPAGEAQSIVDMKKPAMAESAERLLAESKWLPSILRARQSVDAVMPETAEKAVAA
jgi:ParB family chromosome partitioning protein